jgi:hypothetical protein
MPPLSSGSKTEQSSACYQLHSSFSFGLFLDPKKGATCSSETSTLFQRTIRLFIPEDWTFHIKYILLPKYRVWFYVKLLVVRIVTTMIQSVNIYASFYPTHEKRLQQINALLRVTKSLTTVPFPLCLVLLRCLSLYGLNLLDIIRIILGMPDSKIVYYCLRNNYRIAYHFDSLDRRSAHLKSNIVHGTEQNVRL